MLHTQNIAERPQRLASSSLSRRSHSLVARFKCFATQSEDSDDNATIDHPVRSARDVEKDLGIKNKNMVLRCLITTSWQEALLYNRENKVLIQSQPWYFILPSPRFDHHSDKIITLQRALMSTHDSAYNTFLKKTCENMQKLMHVERDWNQNLTSNYRFSVVQMSKPTS